MKVHQHYIRLLVLSLVTIIGGCAAWTPPLAKNEVLTGNDAFLYGRFKIDAPKAFLGLDGYQTLGYVFTCDDAKQYTIRFSISDPLQVIKVSPSRCSFTEVVYTNGDGTIRKRQPAPRSVFQGMRLERGFAYYLGDYFAVSKNINEYPVIRTTWKVEDVKNAFDMTTSEIKSLYPMLADIPTKDQLSSN